MSRAPGTVRISRDIWDDTAFKDEPLTEREAFVWMIMEASFKAREKRVGSVVVMLKRGQLAASTRFLAAAWKWSEPRVRRYFFRLENRRMIERVTDAGLSVITICKYDEYQSAPRVTDAPDDDQTTQQRRTTDANENKVEIRDMDGGGGAQPRDPVRPRSEAATAREQILEAMGLDSSGCLGPSAKFVGNAADMEEYKRWRNDLSLDHQSILEVVREVMVGKNRSDDPGPPHKFLYFTPAMQRLANARNKPTLTPIEGGRRHDDDNQPARASRDPHARALGGMVEAFGHVIAAQPGGRGRDGDGG